MLRTLFSMVIDHGPSYRALQLSCNMCVLSFSIACVDQFPEYRKAYFDTKYTLRNSNYLMYSMITFQGTKKLVNSLLVAYKYIFRKLFKRSCCSKASCCTFVGYLYFESQRLINFASVHWEERFINWFYEPITVTTIIYSSQYLV